MTSLRAVFPIVAALLTRAACAEPPAYRTQGRCDGLPAVTSLKVAPEFCLALAASNLGRPRGVLALGPNHLLVADMGNWNPGHGRLLELTREPGKPFQVTVLLQGLDRPHGLRKDSQGRVLLAETGRISQVDMDPARLRPLITGLPAQGRHPLKSFAVGANDELFINVGSPSDHCEAFDGVQAGSDKGCPQTGVDAPWAAVWKFTRGHGVAPSWEGKPFAWGLRNSVGLALHPDSGELWQAENSRDTGAGARYDKDAPPDELNRVEAGKHYGWPHCTGNNVLDTTFGVHGCGDFAAPARLIPAHAAPLGMLFYKNAGPAAWQGSLVMAWHGYQPTGHRLMAWRFDARHQPVGEPLALIDGWAASAGKHPMGAPTDVDQDGQGRLWITEDRNGDLLLLAPRAAR
jgi:glucose/arabinose dehydrogenase